MARSDKREELLGAYRKTLDTQGKTALAAKFMPGIRFTISDTGVCSAKVMAPLMGLPYPIPIGGTVATEHRDQKFIWIIRSTPWRRSARPRTRPRAKCRVWRNQWRGR